MINFKLIKTKFRKIFNPVLSFLVALTICFTNVTVQTNSLNSVSNNYTNNASYSSYSNSELKQATPDTPSINVSIGSPAFANVKANFDSLYTGSVVMVRNVMFDNMMNIAEGPLGPHVVWSPNSAEQNHDNTIVVIKKEGTNIVQFMNRYTRKVLGVNKSGQMESKLEVQNPNGQFNQYQSFYVDYLPNGNVYFSSVAFPDRVVHLPYGGERHDFTHFTLHDKSNLESTLQVQFKIDLQGDGANTSFGEEPEVVVEAPNPEVTYEVPVQEQAAVQQEQQPPVQTPVQPIQVIQQPTPPKPVVSQYSKIRDGAIVVLRNAQYGYSVKVGNFANGTPIYSLPPYVGNNVDNTFILALKPGSINIYQVINQVTGKILSVQANSKVGSGTEVWLRDRGWGGYQSFYIDELPNGNITLSPVAYPNLVLNLPEGGKSIAGQSFTLWSKEDLINGINRQFTVDVLGYGGDVGK
jgi:Ricin-type beta-trefoil lectin domain-like